MFNDLTHSGTFYSPDGRYIVRTYHDGQESVKPEICEAGTGSIIELDGWDCGHTAVFSPDSKYLTFIGAPEYTANKTVVVWELPGGKTAGYFQLPEYGESSIVSAEFNMDSSVLRVITDDGWEYSFLLGGGRKHFKQRKLAQ